jgi:ribose 5-phosphate isomerase B
MKPTVYFATDHAGFAFKNMLLCYLRDELAYEVVDCGPAVYDEQDDYPDFIALAAKKVSENPKDRAIILGGSGQGEAMVANRFPHVRAAVFYGEPTTPQVDASGKTLSVLMSSREHNDANVLSLGARFLTEATAKHAVATWLEGTFSGEERHVRRIKKIEHANK